MIHFNHLTYTYPNASRPALADVTLRIDEGEFVLVAGPSGAGKSTLLRCLNGLVPHFTGGTLSGRCTVASHDPVAEGPQVLSHVVGFVFQDPEAQFVVDRVEDEIAFALENAAIPPAEMHMRVEEALGLLDLTPLRDRSLETLSGGEKQRLAIAAALALRPRILVLDEPTSQLDPRSAEDVLGALVRLNCDLGLTIILVEHRLERVLPHVDRLVYLPGRGKPVLSGPPRHILRQMNLTPPLVTLGKALGWEPLPLTVEEGRVFAQEMVSGSRFQDSRSNLKLETPKPKTLLQVEGLSFNYGATPTLRGVTLTVGAGELVTLMGRNGSGKTTLLKCIVGLLRPQQGNIRLAGESLIGRETADICRSSGYLPQEPDDLLFADTVAEELEVTLRNHGLLDRSPLAPADLLDRLGLSDLAASYPRDLSVGQRQRVALGAVTITRPRLLLLDEPTRGMDYPAKQALVRLLQEWRAEGAGVLLVTHDVELAAQAAGRVVVLSQGEVTADGIPAKVLTSPPPSLPEAEGSPLPLFAPQAARLFPGTGWLTAEDALDSLNMGASS
ncbi:MAG: ATP-binding cassette domain-containing protein [Chloroflexota bacterium]|nr:ATP-binding cassette domain-containing protein [Chloroflexota bacterium]